MHTPEEDMAGVVHDQRRQYSANVAGGQSRQLNGNNNHDQYGTSRLQISRIDNYNYQDHRRISIMSNDSSRDPSPYPGINSKPRSPIHHDESDPRPSLASRSLCPLDHSVCHPHRTSTWNNVKGFYCRNPRSLSAIIGVVIILIVLAIVLPLYFTAESKFRRSLAEATAAPRTWAQPTTVATISHSGPTLESRNTPLSHASDLADSERTLGTSGWDDVVGQR